jgi:hypothetical protein
MSAECEYLVELPPMQEGCVDCKYWKRYGDDWVDVTASVPRMDDEYYNLND